MVAPASEHGLVAILAKACFLNLFVDRQISLLRANLLHVIIDFLESVDLTELNHFLLALFAQSSWVLPLLPQKVDCGFDRVSPVGPRVALNRDVVRRPQLLIARLVYGIGVPREEFAQKLDVLEHLLIKGQCHIAELESCCADGNRSLEMRG